MLRAIYPGSFDPVTYGHMDIIERSHNLVDELIVGVLCNKAKMPLFSVEERVKMLKEGLALVPGTTVIPFSSVTKQGRDEIWELIENECKTD